MVNWVEERRLQRPVNVESRVGVVPDPVQPLLFADGDAVPRVPRPLDVADAAVLGDLVRRVGEASIRHFGTLVVLEGEGTERARGHHGLEEGRL